MKFCGGRDARNSLQKAQLAEAGSPHLGKDAGARPRKDVTCQLLQHSFEPDLMGLRTADCQCHIMLGCRISLQKIESGCRPPTDLCSIAGWAHR